MPPPHKMATMLRTWRPREYARLPCGHRYQTNVPLCDCNALLRSHGALKWGLLANNSDLCGLYNPPPPPPPGDLCVSVALKPRPDDAIVMRSMRPSATTMRPYSDATIWLPYSDATAMLQRFYDLATVLSCLGASDASMASTRCP